MFACLYAFLYACLFVCMYVYHIACMHVSMCINTYPGRCVIWLQLLAASICMCPKKENALTVYPHMICWCGQDLFGRKGKLQPYVLCLVSRESKSNSDCELLVLKRSDRGALICVRGGGLYASINFGMLRAWERARARARASQSESVFVCQLHIY